MSVRKLRVYVSATLKNEELTGLNYWESEQLPVLEHRAYMSYLTLPVLTDLQSVYSRQLMTKLKLDSYELFQAAEHCLLISQVNRKIMFFKPLLKQVIYFSSLIGSLIESSHINGDISTSSKIGLKDRWFSLDA